MGQGIYYLLTLLAVGVVVHWYIRNDGVGPGERTKGILSMDSPVSDQAQASNKPPGAR